MQCNAFISALIIAAASVDGMLQEPGNLAGKDVDPVQAAATARRTQEREVF